MKMLIGLTGKTGSGKSTAARIFEKLGAFVADCDLIAHEILCDEVTKEKLKSLFSSSIFDTDGSVNRKKLGAIVFADEKKLGLLNSVMHSAIVNKALDMCEKSGKDICIIDGSELEASGIDKKCAYVIVITADEKTRLQRIISRDNISNEDALRRIHAQKDYGGKAIFIENNTDSNFPEAEISALYNKFSGEINVQI